MAKNRSTVEKSVRPVKSQEKARKKSAFNSNSASKKETSLPQKKSLVEELLPELPVPLGVDDFAPQPLSSDKHSAAAKPSAKSLLFISIDLLISFH